MEELKRCPFCGGVPEITQRYDVLGYTKDDEPIEKLRWVIECVNDNCPCWLSSKMYDTEKEAIAAWNNRQPLQQIIEKLEEELNLADAEKNRCFRENPLQFFSAKGYANGISNALDITKELA